MTLEEAAENIGREVAYSPNPGVVERGAIKSVASIWVFVQYGTDCYSKATDPSHLEFAEVSA